MIKEIVLPILGVIVFIIVVGLLVQKSSTINIPGVTTGNSYSTKSVKIDSKEIKAEVADTKDKRTKGLSGRSALAEDNGMLFVFETQNVTSGFWMKDMVIPIDIVWINDGVIAKIDKNVSAPQKGTPDDKLIVYSPGSPVDYVLEVPAGYSDKNNFKVGDSIYISGT